MNMKTTETRYTRTLDGAVCNCSNCYRKNLATDIVHDAWTGAEGHWCGYCVTDLRTSSYFDELDYQDHLQRMEDQELVDWDAVDAASPDAGCCEDHGVIGHLNMGGIVVHFAPM